MLEVDLAVAALLRLADTAVPVFEQVLDWACHLLVDLLLIGKQSNVYIY